MAVSIKKKKRKNNKNGVDIGYGSEPVITGVPTNIELTKALNWYAANIDNKKATKYVVEWMTNNSYNKRTISLVKNSVKLPSIDTAGKLCRLNSRGMEFTDSMNVWVRAFIDNIVEINKEKGVSDSDEETPKKKKRKVSPYHLTVEATGPHIGYIEEQIDGLLFHNKKPDTEIYDYLNRSECSGMHARIVRDHFTPIAEEIDELIAGDKELDEGYSNISKPMRKKFQKYLHKVLEEVNAFETSKKNASKRKRKSKKKKSQTIEKQIKNLKFQKECAEYKLSSISPVDIIGANELWVFNTKYRILYRYEAMDESGFSVKGTTLQNINKSKSIGKKVRKPDELMKEFVKAAKRKSHKLFDDLKAKPSSGTGRINQHCILLKVF